MDCGPVFVSQNICPGRGKSFWRSFVSFVQRDRNSAGCQADQPLTRMCNRFGGSFTPWRDLQTNPGGISFRSPFEALSQPERQRHPDVVSFGMAETSRHRGNAEVWGFQAAVGPFSGLGCFSRDGKECHVFFFF